MKYPKIQKPGRKMNHEAVTRLLVIYREKGLPYSETLTRMKIWFHARGWGVFCMKSRLSWYCIPWDK